MMKLDHCVSDCDIMPWQFCFTDAPGPCVSSFFLRTSLYNRKHVAALVLTLKPNNFQRLGISNEPFFFTLGFRQEDQTAYTTQSSNEL